MSKYFKLNQYWDWFFEQNDWENLFARDLSKDKMKELFSKYVFNINIETSAFCNLKCGYCPMSRIDRKQDFILEKNWGGVIDELADIGYNGRITLCLFNEPLLDLSLPQKINEIRKKMPEVKVALYSNGDYLTAELLDRLIDNGLNWFLVTRHVSKNNFSKSVCKAEILDYIQKLKLEGYITEYKELNDNNVSYAIDYRGMELYIVTNNWHVIGVDRGGVIEELKSKEVRNQPCAKAIRDFNISYEGIVKPCCNIYFGEGADYGTIEEGGILNNYFNNLRNFRIDMLKFGNKSGGCKYCTEPDNASIETKDMRNKIMI